MCEVILFNYLHRDSGNWKKFGCKRFSNPDQLTLAEVEKMIRENLIDKEYFYPNQVGIKKFKFHRNLDDYSWYEFESVEILESKDFGKKTLELFSNFILLLERMMFIDAYLISDQPTTCPLCGARAKIKNEFQISLEIMQYYICLSKECKYRFII